MSPKSMNQPETAAQVASAVAESVQYQGRKASRQGSELRRQSILEAALRLIVREGVRAVRHRAVAAEAEVPLSATTYYFKDINDLITDAFALFVERSAEGQARFWGSMEEELQRMAERLKRDVKERQAVTDQMVELAILYVQRQLQDNREQLLAEQAFRQEALLNPGLRELAVAHRQILSQGAAHFFAVLGSAEPEGDARLLTALILQMEYQGLLDGVEQLDVAAMRVQLRRYLYLVMGL